MKASKALIEAEPDRIANLSNIASLLSMELGHHWTGFYLVKGEELVLGPFQGPIACTRIARAKGVCGDAWDRGESIRVADVEAYPGHIACSAASRSELVVPIRVKGEVVAVLDIDSAHLDAFGEQDQAQMEDLCELIAQHWPQWT